MTDAKALRLLKPELKSMIFDRQTNEAGTSDFKSSRSCVVYQRNAESSNLLIANYAENSGIKFVSDMEVGDAPSEKVCSA